MSEKKTKFMYALALPSIWYVDFTLKKQVGFLLLKNNAIMRMMH